MQRRQEGGEALRAAVGDVKHLSGDPFIRALFQHLIQRPQVRLDGVVDVEEVNPEVIRDAVGDVHESRAHEADGAGEHRTLTWAVNAAESVIKYLALLLFKN